MRYRNLFYLLVLSCLVVMSPGCGDDDPVKPPPPEDHSNDPGIEWGGGDWPSVMSPEFNDNVILGDGVPAITAMYQSKFTPTLSAVRGTAWYIKITRPEAVCTAWYSWSLVGSDWSYEIPNMTYKFNFNWSCFVSNSTLTDYDVCWPLTETKQLTLMENGQWITAQTLPTYSKNVGGNGYRIERKFTLPSQPALHLSMVRHWVQGSGPSGDRTFVEGPVKIEITERTGVNESHTTTFTKTMGASAGLDVKGISLGLNASFQNVTTHTVALEKEVEVKETRDYDVPAGEQWRYIQLYGVERYVFSNSEGAHWVSPTLQATNLGSVDNAVRNVLMIVKYKGGFGRPHASEFIENGKVVYR